MKAVLVQPPFTQLNAPYPAVHYLESFLKARGIEAISFDHSIELYRRIFSRAGLETIFADLEAGGEGTRGLPAGPDARAARELERYLSSRELYLEWIDPLLAFLSGGDPAFAHRLAAAAEFPRGARAAAFLEAAGGRIRAEEARELATLILEDLSDLIRYALDPDFGTVRYAERLARSRGDFGEIEAGLDSAYILRRFYAPLLEEFWAAQSGADLLLLTVPFPGCLAGALACAEAARNALGKKVTIIIGGGYVSTELRSLSDPRIFGFCDYLSFDAGYGSLSSILARLAGEEGGLWRTMRLEGGRVLAEGFETSSCREAEGEGGTGEAPRVSPHARYELEALRSNFPDYASVDFGRYLRAVDSDNPMHRLWSDSPWLKFSLAHGCYWQRCAFCDTQLDYVANFVPAALGAVAAAADAASRRHGLYGIHFVDEALPMAGLLSFARHNRERAARGDRPFHFWGNVRFDASWTADRCEFLAASGLTAVSGGIEIATEKGLAMTNKGFDLAALVQTLVGMRRAGLLVHAYLIYGFPGQDAAEILDSAEVVRQLFAAGLIDSAFWHRFVLTRGSTMMAEHRAGKRPEIKPRGGEGGFAANDLAFEGEAAYDPFDAPLAALLGAWMDGRELDRPAALGLAAAGLEASLLPPAAARSQAAARGRGAARDGKGLGPDHIEALIQGAEARLDEARLGRVQGALQWVAGRPRLAAPDRAGRRRLSWVYRGEMEDLVLPGAAAEALAAALEAASRPQGIEAAGFIKGAGAGMEALAALRAAGLLAV